MDLRFKFLLREPVKPVKINLQKLLDIINNYFNYTTFLF